MHGREIVAALMLIITGICAMTDLYVGRIYNAVLLPATVLCLAVRTLPVCGGSTTVLGMALLRAGMLLLAFLPFWLLIPGGMGGGDVKLYAMIAILLDGRTFLQFLLLSLLVAVGYGLLLRAVGSTTRELRIGPGALCAAVLYAGGIYG